MDINLRCNVLSCRTELTERAVVTTCLHIYCLPCTEAKGLANPHPGQERRCPACRTLLPNPDDVVSALLNLTDDYKASVLSGLDPSAIAECAGRALGFWQYQMTQEVFYQAHLSKSMTDKLSHLDGHLDKIINQANEHIGNLQNKLAAMEIEQENLVNKNSELVDKLRDSGRKLATQKQLYTKLKTQTLQHGLQEAASHTADLTAQSIAESRTVTPGTAGFNPPYSQRLQLGTAGRTHQYGEHFGELNMHDYRNHGRSHSGSSGDHGMPPPARPLQHPRLPNLQSGLQTGTPQHRERIGMPTSHRPAQRSSIPQPTQGFLAGGLNPPSSATRQPVGLNSGRLAAISSGSYGLSAAARIGRASGAPGNTFDERAGRDFGQGNVRGGHFDAGPFGGAYH